MDQEEPRAQAIRRLRWRRDFAAMLIAYWSCDGRTCFKRQRPQGLRTPRRYGRSRLARTLASALTGYYLKPYIQPFSSLLP
jgi:hypothetical protein